MKAQQMLISFVFKMDWLRWITTPFKVRMLTVASEEPQIELTKVPSQLPSRDLQRLGHCSDTDTYRAAIYYAKLAKL